MAIVFMDGFDHYSNTMEARKWDVDFSASRDANNPRTGIGHARLNVTSEYFGKLMVPTLAKVIVGCAVHISDGLHAESYDSFILFYTGSGDFQCSLQYSETDQRFRFRNNSSAVSSVSTNTFDISTGYHHVEVELTFDNVTPANNTVELRVNEVAEIDETFDTNPRATDNIDEVRLAGLATGTDLDVDDFYILNSTSPNNDFLGDTKIVTLHVDADGGLAAWTGSASPDWQQVDDVTPDDNTTNIVSSTNGQQSLFSVDAMTGVSSVKGIQISVAARKDGAGDGDIQILTSPDGGATLYKSSTSVVGAVASVHNFHMQQQDVNPDTASAWTTGLIDSNQFGVEQIS